MKKTIYYAHHLWKYDTEIEEFELDIIRKKLPNYEIINPNKYFDFSEDMTEDEIMEICKNTVAKSNALIFSSLSGVIGFGVFSEIQKAFDIGIPVFCIVADKILSINSIQFRPCNYRTRRTYATIEDMEVREVL